MSTNELLNLATRLEEGADDQGRGVIRDAVDTLRHLAALASGGDALLTAAKAVLHRFDRPGSNCNRRKSAEILALYEAVNGPDPTMRATPSEPTPAAADAPQLLEAIGLAYGYLWCVNNEPGTPHQYPPELAAYTARKVLRSLLTQEQRGQFINRVLLEVRGPAGDQHD